MDPVFFSVYVLSFIISMVTHWNGMKKERMQGRLFYFALNFLCLLLLAVFLLRIPVPPVFDKYIASITSVVKSFLP